MLCSTPVVVPRALLHTDAYLAIIFQSSDYGLNYRHFHDTQACVEQLNSSLFPGQILRGSGQPLKRVHKQLMTSCCWNTAKPINSSMGNQRTNIIYGGHLKGIGMKI